MLIFFVSDSRRFFEKDNNIDTYGLPYDFYSITHFGKNEFSMDDTITIETIDKKYQDIIGEQSMPSRNDYRKICLMYGCEKCAAENKGSHTKLRRSGGGKVIGGNSKSTNPFYWVGAKEMARFSVDYIFSHNSNRRQPRRTTQFL
ncbi:hypothetical protein Y032_0053g2397 [Ancylostoma ceylanicum]|uniref:Peptidase M12A domain-containing protein n=1 Tax=Ancylostoma ceylanicum TaxID=53326 RepID=A0A016U722_9BILA|nr:hypothetical protein Y032_0053g2397 [Ancylostoma ceylanicum]